MIDFNCQMYIGAHASFNPVLVRTEINKKAKLVAVSHKELIDPSIRRLLGAFESLPQHPSSI